MSVTFCQRCGKFAQVAPIFEGPPRLLPATQPALPAAAPPAPAPDARDLYPRLDGSLRTWPGHVSVSLNRLPDVESTPAIWLTVVQPDGRLALQALDAKKIQALIDQLQDALKRLPDLPNDP